MGVSIWSIFIILRTESWTAGKRAGGGERKLKLVYLEEVWYYCVHMYFAQVYGSSWIRDFEAAVYHWCEKMRKTEQRKRIHESGKWWVAKWISILISWYMCDLCVPVYVKQIYKRKANFNYL